MTTDSTSFKPDDCVMVDARVLGAHQYVFVAHSERALSRDRYQAMVVAYGDGVWRLLGEWPWRAVGIEEIIVGDERRLCVLGRDGQIGVVSQTGRQDLKLDPARPVGPFRGLRRIGGSLLAFGMKREVFESADALHWVRDTAGMESDADGRKLSISEQIKLRLSNVGGINGIAEDLGGSRVAVGMRGEIWEKDGARWTRVDSPTNLMLKDVMRAPDGDLFICGQSGTLIRGRPGAWGMQAYEGTQGLDLSSLVAFNGRIFIADGHALHVYHDRRLEVIDHGADEIVPCAVVAANDQWLISVAGQEVWETRDGASWNCILG